VAILSIGLYLIRRERETAIAGIRGQLQTVADLKALQIAEWRSERLRDGRALMTSPSLSQDVTAFLDHPASTEARSRITAWLASHPTAGDPAAHAPGQTYEGALLLDENLDPAVVVGDAPAASDESLREVRGAAVSNRDVSLSDLLRDPVGGHIFIETYVPVARPAGRRGLIVLRISPHTFLYPLIQSWPTASKSAETLLIRRDGDRVVYLNELRHRAGTALTLTFPLNDPTLPAARAARGEFGTFSGADYRGVPTLASVRDVPGSPWFIVAKVDEEEIYAPLRAQAWMAGGGLASLLLASVSAAAFLWRQRMAAEAQVINAELERGVRERTHDLDAANQELQAFAYSVSHDLRAPLRGIDGWSLALIEDYGERLDDTARGYLGTIRQEAQRMGQLIDDMLALSKVTRVDLRSTPVDLSALASIVAARLQQLHPERKIEFVIEPGLAALGDPPLLEILLTNLLGNAVKFTGPRPMGQIEFSRSLGANPNTGETENVFMVRDNGVGFDTAHAKKLFGAFQRMHKASEFPGTGVGLATVQRIVHRHHGRTWAESELNRGATFYFTLAEAA